MRTALTIPFVLALASTFALASDVVAQDAGNVNLMDQITALHVRDDIHLEARSAKHKSSIASKKISIPPAKTLHVNKQAQVIPEVAGVVGVGTTLDDAAAVVPATTLVAAAAIVPSAVAADPANNNAINTPVVVPSATYHPVTGPSGSTYFVGFGYDRPTPTFAPAYHKREEEGNELEERDNGVWQPVNKIPGVPLVSSSSSSGKKAKAKGAHAASAKKAAATSSAVVKPLADTYKGPAEELLPIVPQSSSAVQASYIDQSAAAIVPTVIVDVPATQIPAVLAPTSATSVDSSDNSDPNILSLIAAAEGADATTAQLNVASDAGAIASQAATMSPQTGQYGAGHATPTFVPNFPPGVHKRFAKQKRH